jgi:hypothetical protein
MQGRRQSALGLTGIGELRGVNALCIDLAEARKQTVRSAIYPVVGEQTLRDVVREAKAATARSRRASARCCTPPTRASTAACCRGCLPRWTFGSPVELGVSSGP